MKTSSRIAMIACLACLVLAVTTKYEFYLISSVQFLCVLLVLFAIKYPTR